MSEPGHLPECCMNMTDAPERDGHCICDRLRACEARIREEYGSLRTMHACADRARANALDAARKAVADHRVPWPTATGDFVNEGIDAALAAIDALKEKP